VSKKQDQSPSQKKALLVTEKKSRSYFRFLLIGLCAGFAASLGFAFWPRPAEQAPQAAAAAQVKSGQVAYEAAAFEDGRARLFKHQADDGLTIRYFILKSSDGVIRAAFDACDVCWPANKGYQQQGDEVVCRNCGRRFPSVQINVVQGGCNPAPLKRRIEDGRVVIEVQDILDGRQYFDFSRRG